MFLINLQNKDTFLHHSQFQFLEKHHVFPHILGKDISLCHTFQVLHERVLTVHIVVNGYLALVMKMKDSQFTQSIGFSKRSHRNVHQPTAVTWILVPCKAMMFPSPRFDSWNTTDFPSSTPSRLWNKSTTLQPENNQLWGVMMTLFCQTLCLPHTNQHQAHHHHHHHQYTTTVKYLIRSVVVVDARIGVSACCQTGPDARSSDRNTLLH